jgi:hypothetical protein
MLVSEPADAGNGAALIVIDQADDSGRFQLEDIPPGNYFIIAGRVDAPIYYPGTSSRDLARSIAVTPRARIGQIDFTITPESSRPAEPFTDRIIPNTLIIPRTRPTLPVNGRILIEGNPGAPAPFSATLRATSEDRATQITGIFTSNVTTTHAFRPAPDGAFTVSLPAGRSRLTLSYLPEGYTLKSMTSGGIDLRTQSIDVQAGAAEIVIVLTADLRARFRISGHVFDVKGRPLMGDRIELTGESGTVRIIIGPEGYFEFIRVLPGRYTLRMESPDSGVPDRPVVITDQHLEVELRATSR